MPPPPKHPAVWFTAFAAWLGLLWWLSSLGPSHPSGPSIPHLDKVAHFGYFLGGAGLLSAALFRLNPANPNWPRIIGITLLTLAAVGVLDEWHQTHTPGRDGNSLGDWLADITGATIGTLIFYRLHRLIR
jgi:VanZ family protein